MCFDTLSRLGWGLEALFEACLCGLPMAHAAESAQLKIATNSLWVIAGCGTVQHLDTHGAQRFSKRRKKGIAEKNYYARTAVAAAGGVASFDSCKKSARNITKADTTFAVRGTGSPGYRLSSVMV